MSRTQGRHNRSSAGNSELTSASAARPSALGERKRGSASRNTRITTCACPPSSTSRILAASSTSVNGLVMSSTPGSIRPRCTKRVARVARRKQHLQLGSSATASRRKHGAVHTLWQHHVREKKIEVTVRLPQDLERGDAIRSLRHVVAKAAQHTLRERAHLGLVFDEQYSFSAGLRRRARTRGDFFGQLTVESVAGRPSPSSPCRARSTTAHVRRTA